MRLQPLRGSFTVLATFLVLAISFDSSPILPAVPKATRPAPDPRAIALVDELTGHSAGRGKAAEPRVVRSADLDSALSGRPQHGFDLFAVGEGEREEGGAAGERRAEYEVVRKFPFGRAIARAAERQRVDPLLLAAIVETESAFAPDAVSTEGAIGLMQLIPETGELYGKTDLFDPYVNLEVGSRYIGALLERYHGDLALALAAYNCGPATVTRYGSVPPFAETRDFVKSVLALYVDHRQSVWKRSRESTDLLSSRSTERSPRGRGRSTVLGTPHTPAARSSLFSAR